MLHNMSMLLRECIYVEYFKGQFNRRVDARQNVPVHDLQNRICFLEDFLCETL